MPEKSPRRLALEASLAADPDDRFLRYGLALQCLREGDVHAGRARLEALIADHPDEVAAYQQLGQSFLEDGVVDQARSILIAGVAAARRLGQTHAEAEMSALIDMIGNDEH
jgi:thioredoxin-like negative regulator of GroEL